MQRHACLSDRLPTTLGFSPLDDRCRMPGRFFYRRLSAAGR